MDITKTLHEEFNDILRDAFEKGESDGCIPIQEFIEDLSARLVRIIK